jgi:predicted DNA-binding mobile mystery protein A
MVQNFEAARRTLDERFKQMGHPGIYMRPLKGWIRAIRDALGMSTTQMAKRLDVPQSRITAMEQGELTGSLSINTLRRAAEALDCQLIYALVPKQSLRHTIEAQVDRQAKAILEQTGHTMKLENQEVTAQELHAQYERLVAKLLQGSPKKLWDEP